MSTIERLKAHQERIGAATMDAAIVDLMGRAENGADGKKEVYRAAPELLEHLSIVDSFVIAAVDDDIPVSIKGAVAHRAVGDAGAEKTLLVRHALPVFPLAHGEDDRIRGDELVSRTHHLRIASESERQSISR